MAARFRRRETPGQLSCVRGSIVKPAAHVQKKLSCVSMQYCEQPPLKGSAHSFMPEKAKLFMKEGKKCYPS